jgi:acetoacetate decarboxylase
VKSADQVALVAQPLPGVVALPLHEMAGHVDGTLALDIRQITGRRLTDVKIHECWRGPCTVELRPNAQFPLHRLPVLEECDGYYWKADFTLVTGEVLHDYLA